MTFDDVQSIREVDPRRVFGPGETPAELAEIILPELDKLIAEGKKAKKSIAEGKKANE